MSWFFFLWIVDAVTVALVERVVDDDQEATDAEVRRAVRRAERDDL